MNREPLRRLQVRLSDSVRRHRKLTPFPGEPVGWMIEQAGADLPPFSSDVPHPEGGRDPLGAFEEALGAVDETVRDRFCAENLAELLGPRVPGHRMRDRRPAAVGEPPRRNGQAPSARLRGASENGSR